MDEYEAFLISLERRLGKMRRLHRHRSLAESHGLDFSSNDYLGLSNHPRIRAAVAQAIADGVSLGSGGSRLLGGNRPEHQQLERRLAAFKGSERALIFNSGYEANFGVLSTLCGAGDQIIADQLIHASLYDGAKHGKAQLDRFQHNDLNDLERLLKLSVKARRRFVVVESLYSMDGDLAPLVEISTLCRDYQAHLIIDEAHATGLFGPKGAGLSSAYPLAVTPLVTVHTCGKAWGGFGAFISCSNTIADYLINFCRNFIYTTALPPLLLAHWQAVLDFLENEPDLARSVLHKAERFRQAVSGKFNTGQSASQIVPLIVGSDEAACDLAATLQEAGFDIRAVRPPTVPAGTARVRISFTAQCGEAELEKLIQTCLAYESSVANLT